MRATAEDFALVFDAAPALRAGAPVAPAVASAYRRVANTRYYEVADIGHAHTGYFPVTGDPIRGFQWAPRGSTPVAIRGRFDEGARAMARGHARALYDCYAAPGAGGGPGRYVSTYCPREDT